MDKKTQVILNETSYQRNQYADACAALAGEIAQRDDQIAALTKELEALKAPATAKQQAHTE